MSTLPRRWSADTFGTMFTFGDKADVGVKRGVDAAGRGEGGNIFSAESGVEGKGGRE